MLLSIYEGFHIDLYNRILYLVSCFYENHTKEVAFTYKNYLGASKGSGSGTVFAYRKLSKNFMGIIECSPYQKKVSFPERRSLVPQSFDYFGYSKMCNYKNK